MILSPGRGYVFVHIPKTGGTALALALEARAMADDVLIGDTPKAKRRRQRLRGVEARGRLWKHSTLADLDGWRCEDELKGLFAFTLVRNPWDRMVSYYHWLREQGFSHSAVALARDLQFADFVQHPVTLESLRASPAASYMRLVSGEVHCSLYIRLEHFADDAQPLFQHLGFEFSLPRANASARLADWRSYYDAGTARAVAEACAADIEQFEYSFND